MWNEDLVPRWKRGKLFVMSAPAGSGKTTLAKRLVSSFPSIVQVPSVTTRPARSDEVDGVDYHFVTEEEFVSREKKGDFLESVELYGYRYGTSKELIEKCREQGFHALLVIDTRGAIAVSGKSDPVLIFIKPPSLEVLKDRLLGRGSEDKETLKKRLDWSEKELEDEKHFTYSIVNDEVKKAFDVLASIIVAECHKLR